MKYYIISTEKLQKYRNTCLMLGLIQNSERWSDEKEAEIMDTINALENLFESIPEELDMIVGYSTPNPNEVKIWNRDERGKF